VWQYTFGQIGKHSKVDPEASTAPLIGPNDSRRVESFQEKHTERYLEKRDHAKKTEGIVESSLIKLGRAQHDNMVVLNSKMDRLESHVDDVLERHVRRLEDRVETIDGKQVDILQKLDQSLASTSVNLDQSMRADAPAKARTLRRRSWLTVKNDAMKHLPTMYFTSPDREGGLWHGIHLCQFEAITMRPTGEPDDEIDLLFTYKNAELDGPQRHENSNILVIFKSEAIHCRKESTLAELGRPRMPDGRLVQRDYVSEAFKPWDVPLGLDVYRPQDYTSPYVYYFSSAAASVGPYFKWASDQSEETIARETAIARRELQRKYGVELLVDPLDGRPLNPSGRQGVRGLGVLGKWGPNYACHFVITRPTFDSDDTPMERGGKRMQTVLLEKRVDGRWLLPGQFQPGGSIVPQLRLTFGLDEESMHDSEELQETEQILLDAPESTELIECAGDDDRDTDNAWVQ